MIELHLRLTRGGFRVELDVALERGATGIFGPSGAGKSSVLLALAGLLPVDELRLLLDGEVLVDGARPPAHRRRVGMVFQDHRLFPHRDLAANLRYGMPRGAARADFDEVVELLDLGALLDRRPAQCSGGERQRAALARALLGAPRLLLLDEPLASLDPARKQAILPYLRRVREVRGVPMLMVSHDLGELLAVTDELLLLDQGRLAGQGALVELATEARALELLHDGGFVFALRGEVAPREAHEPVQVRVDGEPGGLINCGNCAEPPGTPVEVLLQPDDVILAEPPFEARTSLTNVLSGKVVSVTQSEARCLVTVDCGFNQPLLAEVTERSVRELNLAPGLPIVALFKAQATRTRRLVP